MEADCVAYGGSEHKSTVSHEIEIWGVQDSPKTQSHVISASAKP
jgi:hypothetical protein